ncbi:MAG: hypothetical protein M1828_001858 [Chrysothrix sp. TS-e1954]|nr:MAG: hypothetical protein M1828_001858 [Chrysothrix sp. TS-e1954]
MPMPVSAPTSAPASASASSISAAHVHFGEMEKVASRAYGARGLVRVPGEESEDEEDVLGPMVQNARLPTLAAPRPNPSGLKRSLTAPTTTTTTTRSPRADRHASLGGRIGRSLSLKRTASVRSAGLASMSSLTSVTGVTGVACVLRVTNHAPETRSRADTAASGSSNGDGSVSSGGSSTAEAACRERFIPCPLPSRHHHHQHHHHHHQDQPPPPQTTGKTPRAELAAHFGIDEADLIRERPDLDENCRVIIGVGVGVGSKEGGAGKSTSVVARAAAFRRRVVAVLAGVCVWGRRNRGREEEEEGMGVEMRELGRLRGDGGLEGAEEQGEDGEEGWDVHTAEPVKIAKGRRRDLDRF